MRLKRFLYCLVLVPLVIAAVNSCSEDRGTDYDRTNLKQITDLVTISDVGRTAFPRIWFDTVSRLAQYAKTTAAMDEISPLDFWVDIVSYGCTVTIIDSCAPDEFNEGDSCSEIALENGVRARAYVVHIQDTIVCNYNIVNRSDSSVTTKNVKYKEIQTAVAAKLEKNETQYGGWRIFAIGRQRHGVGFTLASFPQIDSIVLESRARDEVRRAYYPERSISYTALRNIPTLYTGEPLRITAYTRPYFSNPPINDAYVHYADGDRVHHEWMGGDISSDVRFQIFEWDINESSGLTTGLYSQITVELFQGLSLRDTRQTQFANLLWAMTYRME
ncbi:MAG: hypothetical protein WBP29_07295 [Candidatus Zixiibacteriota bacterium]